MAQWRNIIDFEKNPETLGVAGLWKSINFVKLHQVRGCVKKNNLQMKVVTNIITNMIDRFDTDVAFAQRQRKLKILAKTIRKLGLLKLLKIGLVQNFMPYIHIELTLK